MQLLVEGEVVVRWFRCSICRIFGCRNVLIGPYVICLRCDVPTRTHNRPAAAPRTLDKFDISPGSVPDFGFEVDHPACTCPDVYVSSPSGFEQLDHDSVCPAWLAALEETYVRCWAEAPLPILRATEGDTPIRRPLCTAVGA